jgi:hypothetical protein
VRRLVDKQLAIDEEIRKDIARARRGIDKNDHVEPEPYSVREVAHRIRRSPREVGKMVSRGELSCITYENGVRISVSEVRRCVDKEVTALEGIQLGIAQGIRYGLVEEVGLDKHGNTLYKCKRSG